VSPEFPHWHHSSETAGYSGEDKEDTPVQLPLFPKASAVQRTNVDHDHESTQIPLLDDFNSPSLDAFSQLDNIEDRLQEANPPSNRSAQEIYFELVYLAEDISSTLWIDPLYEGRYQVAIAATIREARAAGLNSEEIHLALMIGTLRGRQKLS
jgi:hypothetical protein